MKRHWSITIDVGELAPGESIMMITRWKRASRIMEQYKITYQTAFVLAYLDIDVPILSQGFISAVHAYVWSNDDKRLTKGLRQKCNKALERLCQTKMTVVR